MRECRRQRKRMREFFAGDPSNRESLERHNASCPACRTEFRELQEIISGTDRRLKPDPGPEFWAGYWDRLQARLAREDEALSRGAAAPCHATPSRFRILRRPALPAAAAALLIAGVLIGRWSIRTWRPSGPSGVAAVIRTSALDIRTNRYLDRSKRILLALVNYVPAAKDAYGLDLPGQKTASRALVREAAGLRGDLARAKERRLERLVGDLQTILLQIANLKSDNDLDAVDIVRAGVEGRDVLFQINLAQIRSGSADVLKIQ